MKFTLIIEDTVDSPDYEDRRKTEVSHTYTNDDVTYHEFMSDICRAISVHWGYNIELSKLVTDAKNLKKIDKLRDEEDDE